MNKAVRWAVLAFVFAFTLGAASTIAAMPICGEGPRITCVVDGDTFWLAGVKYRIADIDAPEVSRPSCAAELALGNRATNRLADLLQHGRFEVRPTGTDRYNRTLAIVIRDGRSIGMQLVGEGLARRWDGSRRSWCSGV
jgi:micrococcal nuclease